MSKQTLHPSHITRISMDASTYDEICINCNHTDLVPGGWGKLADPCPKPLGAGGITMKEYERRRAAKEKALAR
jgi:hypothetical protein